jgi:hypothetical protein
MELGSGRKTRSLADGLNAGPGLLRRTTRGRRRPTSSATSGNSCANATKDIAKSHGCLLNAPPSVTASFQIYAHRHATSRFQMNSTSSAQTVAPRRPARRQVLPAPKQSEQSHLVRLQLLRWLARYSGYDASDKPARLTHLDYRDERAILIKGRICASCLAGTGNTPSIVAKRRWCLVLAAPHSIFNVQRHPSARTHRAFRASALQTWREVVAAA